MASTYEYDAKAAAYNDALDVTLPNIKMRMGKVSFLETPTEKTPSHLIIVYYTDDNLEEPCCYLNLRSKLSLTSQLKAYKWTIEPLTYDCQITIDVCKITHRDLVISTKEIQCKVPGGSLAFDTDAASRFLSGSGDLKIPFLTTEASARDMTKLISNFGHYWSRLVLLVGPNQMGALLTLLDSEEVFTTYRIGPLGLGLEVSQTTLSADTIILGAFLVLVAPLKLGSIDAITGFLQKRLKTLSSQLPLTILPPPESFLNDFIMLAEVKTRYAKLYQCIYRFFLTATFDNNLLQILQGQWRMILSWAELTSFDIIHSFAVNPCTGAHTIPIVVLESIEVEKTMKELETEALKHGVDVKYYSLCFGHPPKTETRNFQHVGYCAVVAKLKEDSATSWDNFKTSCNPTRVTKALLENWTYMPLEGTGAQQTLNAEMIAWLKTKGIEQATVGTMISNPPRDVTVTNPRIRRPNIK